MTLKIQHQEEIDKKCSFMLVLYSKFMLMMYAISNEWNVYALPMCIKTWFL